MKYTRFGYLLFIASIVVHADSGPIDAYQKYHQTMATARDYDSIRAVVTPEAHNAMVQVSQMRAPTQQGKPGEPPDLLAHLRDRYAQDRLIDVKQSIKLRAKDSQQVVLEVTIYNEDRKARETFHVMMKRDGETWKYAGRRKLE